MWKAWCRQWLLVTSRLKRIEDGLQVDPALAVEEAKCVGDLVKVFADIDSTELGVTELVTHSIDTGDSLLIKQPARRVPFALRRTMEEMVVEQGVIEPPGPAQWC